MDTPPCELAAFRERQAAERAISARIATEAAASPGSGTVDLALFIMAVLLPGQSMGLNIFEPRYRLLTRRALASNRRFGMAGVDGHGRLLPYATEVEILESVAQPDGRFHLEVIGRRRARVHSSRDSPDGAGYRVASVTFDPPGAATAAAPAALAALALAADAAATRWAGRLTALGPAAWAELCGRAGERPPPTQPERLSWWLAAMLPVNGADTAALGAPGTAERLRRMVALVDGLEARRAQGAGPGGCEHM